MANYRLVLREPHMAALFAAALVARFPIGINGLAMVLFLREETGSFSVAGAVAGGLALGVGIGAPFTGRFVDRRGPRVLLPLALGHAAGLLGLLALGSTGAATILLVAVAIASGASFPPSPSVLRARFPVLLERRPDLLPSAYALDSVLLELTFVGAPLLVALLVATIGPSAALVASAVAVLGGIALFLALLPAERPVAEERRTEGFLGALRAPGIRTLVVTMLPVGFALGALEVALPAFSREESSAELAGVLLAIWSIGSAAGGFVYGARPRRAPLAHMHLRFTLLFPLAILPLLIAPSAAVMAVLLVPAGMFIAPIIATRNELASVAAPPGTATEALTWPLTALVGGISLGAGAAGGLVDGSGWRAAVTAAVVAAALGGLVAAARRGTLSAVPATG